MTLFGPSMAEKNHGRSYGEENFEEFPVTVGGRGWPMHGGIERFFHTRGCVCARRWDLTEPERGVHLVNPSNSSSYINEPDRSIPLAVN